jgi:acyl-CoA hydrolase
MPGYHQTTPLSLTLLHGFLKEKHFPITMEPYTKEPVTLIEEVFPQDTNSYNTLFGGRLLSLMDKAGGIACAKFAHREFVTISIDTLKFIAPAHQGDLLEVTGQVVFTSSHTACTKVTAFTLNKSDWKKKKICEGYFFFVAIDSMMRPIPIPQFIVEDEEEQIEYDAALAIRQNMLNNKE